MTQSVLIPAYDAVVMGEGFTLALDRSPVDSGYAVSATSEQFTLSSTDISFPDFENGVREIIRTFPAVSVVGGWVCPKGHLHLDPVEIVTDLPSALARAAELEQEAIFDLASHETIQVPAGAADRSGPH